MGRFLARRQARTLGQDRMRRLAVDPQDRPLARDPIAFRKLFDDRQASYALADFRVDGNGDPEATVAAILALPLWK